MSEFVIAAPGASAGGLEALEKFFRNMPVDAGIGFIVVQHLAPDHASALADLPARCTSMPGEQAQEQTRVAPNRVLIIPPNATLTVKDGTLRLEPPTEPRGRRMPIDNLFSSLAEDCAEHAVCIMLSGTVPVIFIRAHGMNPPAVNRSAFFSTSRSRPGLCLPRCRPRWGQAAFAGQKWIMALCRRRPER